MPLFYGTLLFYFQRKMVLEQKVYLRHTLSIYYIHQICKVLVV
jgi:hypothetical protein